MANRHPSVFSDLINDLFFCIPTEAKAVEIPIAPTAAVLIHFPSFSNYFCYIISPSEFRARFLPDVQQTTYTPCTFQSKNHPGLQRCAKNRTQFREVLRNYPAGLIFRARPRHTGRYITTVKYFVKQFSRNSLGCHQVLNSTPCPCKSSSFFGKNANDGVFPNTPCPHTAAWHNRPSATWSVDSANRRLKQFSVLLTAWASTWKMS